MLVLGWPLLLLPSSQQLCNMALDRAPALPQAFRLPPGLAAAALACCAAAVLGPAVSHLRHRPAWGLRQTEHPFSTRALAECQVLAGGLAVPPHAVCGSKEIQKPRDPQTWGLLPVSLAVSMEQNQIQCCHYAVISSRTTCADSLESVFSVHLSINVGFLVAENSGVVSVFLASILRKAVFSRMLWEWRISVRPKHPLRHLECLLITR